MRGTFMIWLVITAVILPGVAWSAGDPAKGKKKYMEICAACHGESGKGDGPAAAGLPVKPRDHTDTSYMGKLTDQQIFEVIKRGGAAVGRSPVMPQWGLLLSDQQIHNLVTYIRTLARHPQ